MLASFQKAVLQTFHFEDLLHTLFMLLTLRLTYPSRKGRFAEFSRCSVLLLKDKLSQIPSMEDFMAVDTAEGEEKVQGEPDRDVLPPIPPVAVRVTQKQTRRLAAMSQLPERLIFCIDIGEEMEATWPVRQRNMSRLEVLAITLQAFIRRKLSFNPQHEFAIVTMADKPEWMLNFTSEVDAVEKVMRELHTEPLSGEPFDFSELFDLIEERTHITEIAASYTHTDVEGGAYNDSTNSFKENEEGEDMHSIQSVVRALVIYGRSNPPIPVLSKGIPTLLHQEAFYLDAVYIRCPAPAPIPPQQRQIYTPTGSPTRPNSADPLQPVNAARCQQEIFDFLGALEGGASHKTAYFMDQWHDTIDLQKHFSILLAHPIQRDQQAALMKLMETTEYEYRVGPSIPPAKPAAPASAPPSSAW